MVLKNPLAKSGEQPVSLAEHLRSVANYAQTIASAYRCHWDDVVGPDLADRIAQSLVLSALAHDWGKIAVGFQRTLENRKHRWEFRHEVLSTAILLASGFQEESIKELTAAAVLTHHRDLQDNQLCRNAGWVSMPIPEILEEVQRNFLQRLEELQPFWEWLQDFCSRQPELSGFSLPSQPQEIPLPWHFIERLKQTLAERSALSDREALAFLLTRGWLMATDHAVSAGVTEFKVELPSPKLPPLRPFQQQVGQNTGTAFLEAPTGSGKTFAAVSWALRNRKGGERVFYLLPYQASIEAMADTLQELFGGENVAVLHARALDYAFQDYFEQAGEYEAAYTKAREEVEVNRLAHKPIKVATPFQLLKWLFGIPRFEIGVSEMVGGVFIFDEIHAYDAHVVALIAEMVRVMKQLGGRFLFMSATFPQFLKNLLTEAVGETIPEFSLRTEETDDWTRRFISQVRHWLRWHDRTLEELLPLIVQSANAGQRVLVVANRVAQAQELYRQLREKVEGVHLLHSRFTRRDRVAKEQAIIQSLRGKQSTDVRVLVATQVVEVSLDISFDTIFTEIAPVDDLLQRLGRVNRYGEHPDGVEIHVAKQFDEDRLQYVYDLERVTATLENAPEDGAPLTIEAMTQWVQQVYQSGWTEKESKRFEQARSSFQQVLHSLHPLHSAPEGKDEFYGLFQSVEILPRRFYEEFRHHWEQKHYLLATQLLVPVPIGTYQLLKKAGRLTQLKEKILMADASYDPDLGLLPKEVDLDAQFL